LTTGAATICETSWANWTSGAIRPAKTVGAPSAM
jgi:hypothetical protein